PKRMKRFTNVIFPAPRVSITVRPNTWLQRWIAPIDELVSCQNHIARAAADNFAHGISTDLRDFGEKPRPLEAGHLSELECEGVAPAFRSAGDHRRDHLAPVG